MINFILNRNYLIFTLLFILSCSEPQQRLPFLGTPEVNGKDTIYPKVEHFEFLNQDSLAITDNTFKNKIYITDFIFLSCPTICPMMNNEMKKVYDAYKNNKSVLFLSHTIDPENDSISRLKTYANNLKINHSKWHFVTGNKAEIYSMAENSYYSIAYQDSTAPGGFAHSGGLLLIDKNRHIRGVYDGTNPEMTKLLIKDIKRLLEEK